MLAVVFLGLVYLVVVIVALQSLLKASYGLRKPSLFIAASFLKALLLNTICKPVCKTLLSLAACLSAQSLSKQFPFYCSLWHERAARSLSLFFEDMATARKYYSRIVAWSGRDEIACRNKDGMWVNRFSQWLVNISIVASSEENTILSIKVGTHDATSPCN